MQTKHELVQMPQGDQIPQPPWTKENRLNMIFKDECILLVRLLFFIK